MMDFFYECNKKEIEKTNIYYGKVPIIIFVIRSDTIFFVVFVAYVKIFVVKKMNV